MKLGLITGMIIATRKNENLIGQKLLIIQPIDSKQNSKGDKIIAVDTVGAGVGEIIFYASGYAATKAFENQDVPIDAAIIGIVDKIEEI